MTRKSVAEKILERLESSGDEGGPYILIYAFDPGGKIRTGFYDNLRRILNTLEDGLTLQRGVIRCQRLKTAQALEMLAEHYGAEARRFKVEEAPTNSEWEGRRE